MLCTQNTFNPSPTKNPHRLKNQRMQNYSMQREAKKSGIAMLYSDKVDVKTKLNERGKQDQHILAK